MRHTVQIFIVILVTATVAVGFGLLALVENPAVSQRLLDEKQAELTRLVTFMTEAIAISHDPDLIDELLAREQAVKTLGDARLSLIGGDGRLLKDSLLVTEEQRLGAGDHSARPEVMGALKDGLGISSRISAISGQQYLFVAGRVVLPDQPDLPLVLRLGMPMAAVNSIQNDLRQNYLWTSLILIILAAVISFMATKPLNREIKELVSAAGDLADGNLARRIVRQPKGELARLGLALNRLASRFSRQTASSGAGKERLLAILDNMSEGVLVTDADGHITNSNPTLTRMFNLEHPPTGFPGESLRFPEFNDALGRAARGERMPPLTLVLPGSPERFLEVRMRPLGDEYNHQGVVAVFHDLTSRQRLYTLRREIVARMSQELRLPLDALDEAVSALEEKSARDQDLAPIVKMLRRHRDRLDEMSHDLLELARLESLRKSSLKKTAIDIETLFKEVTAELPPKYEPEAGRIELALKPEAAVLNGDREILKSALRNLVDNALKYSTPGTPIVISTSVDGQENIDVSIASQGSSLTEEERERAFERFYRSDRSRRLYKDGVGLGLAIVKHAAQVHGGRVSVESHPGGETVFTMTLPAKL